MPSICVRVYIMRAVADVERSARTQRLGNSLPAKTFRRPTTAAVSLLTTASQHRLKLET